jgi:hypothetical protein
MTYLYDTQRELGRVEELHSCKKSVREENEKRVPRGVGESHNIAS